MFEVKHFPKDMSTFAVNKKSPIACLMSGLFEESTDVNGVSRHFYTYIKEGLLYNSPCLVIAPPAETPTMDFLEQSFWVAFAEQHNLFLHILAPENGAWQTDGTDADYMNKVYIQIQSRQGYVTMQDNIYAIGIGGGADIAQQAVMKMSSEWSGLATFGDLGEQALLNANVLNTAVNTGKTELSVSSVKSQVPVWMAWQENIGSNAAVADYWKKQNASDEERFSNELADEIYFPGKVSKMSQINEERISQVRITNRFSGEISKPFADAVWDFLSAACRHRGYGKKMLRNRIDPDAYGFVYHTMEWQGFTRCWYEYVPESVKDSGDKAPLVVCMHGRGGTAQSFLSLSDMSRVAEERGFIAIFPEAGVSQQRPNSLRNLLLWNGNYQGEDIDDVGFVLKIVEGAKQRYAVDETRVYACGQSSGGMMTSELALKAPEVFAAVSPWSAIISPDHKCVPPTEIVPPVPYMFLFGENDWLCVDREHGELEYHVAPDIAVFLRNLMKIYGLGETPARYNCGELSYYVYRNAKKTPMLIVGTVKGMSHANYPKESWIAYEEFLAKFSKTKDGTLLYMGESAT